ncbi:MAG: outer membrane protein assembly factor BamE [Gammaproteobacteria bacterium WSBS_2016_MAG_OTU1]
MRFFIFCFKPPFLAVVLSCLFAVGCSYKSEIRQGNDELPERIKEVQVGMSKTEVHALLGTNRKPAVFKENNWVYYYRRRTPGFFPTVEEWSIQLVFEGNTLSAIRPLKIPENASINPPETDGEISQ